MHHAYQAKLSELRETTPILQRVTRREVLQYRLHHLQQQLDQGAMRYDQQHEMLLKMQQFRDELHFVTQQLEHEVSQWEGRHGKFFRYRNSRLMDTLGS